MRGRSKSERFLEPPGESGEDAHPNERGVEKSNETPVLRGGLPAGVPNLVTETGEEKDSS